MHYYKRNLGDYAKKAGRLSMLQHGAYTLLIDTCYDREQFPTRDEAIDWTWASSTAEVEAVEFVLRKFFVLEDGRYVQKRIQEELAAYHETSQTNKRIATEREAKRNASSTERAQTVNEAPPNHKPLTTNQEPVGETAPAAQTPLPPPQKPEKPKREQTTLSVYLAACKESRAKPVPDNHASKQWAHDAGISTEMLQIAWLQFRDRYTTDEKAKGKRYKDWPGHFANAVKGNWFKLWYMGDDGRPAWTSTGLTHKAALDAKQRREAGNA